MCLHVLFIPSAKKHFLIIASGNTLLRSLMTSASMGPVKESLDNARSELKLIPSTEKHWLCSGNRSVAIAATLLQQSKVIAMPTDTVYGFAASASDVEAIQRLYDIKKRVESKPLAICLSNVDEVTQWAVTNELPPLLLEKLLPGPYTVILKRKPSLNPALNPGTDSVGIRVPNSKFIRSVAKIIGPIALTSANVSKEPSSLHPDEFSTLWPELDGIFYAITNTMKKKDARRVGSTVVDLSQPGCYEIVRNGIAARIISGILKKAGLRKVQLNDTTTCDCQVADINTCKV
ncbi:yrdC domain-containing protein, mitochondrial isoform X2 [Odontomachus brunneus]|uniref:yrdC domain-containing protein, mitochondrial isoform X2 n=1 Tax=Odontomachus brunneus TaxID=486640 RepID=UPI0013F23C6C|nr:yrdC domain-containing protein, mitochondrial isoform X2 [Odontomachus brunneus]